MADGAVFPRRAGGKKLRRLVPALLLEDREVDRIGVHARRRAGLEAQEPHPRFAQTVRQQPGGDAVVGSGLAAVPADDDPPAERRTGRKDDSFCREERAERALYAADTAVFDAQRRDLALHKREVCRPLDGALHIRLIRAPVGL